jgi:hypothetical protein
MAILQQLGCSIPSAPVKIEIVNEPALVLALQGRNADA